MKSTISDNGQIFNVKAIAANGLAPSAIPEGQFGIVDTDTGLTFGAPFTGGLPDNFMFVSKLNGRVYYSFDTIARSSIKNVNSLAYTPEQVNIWTGIVESCDCQRGVQLGIYIDEDSLIRRDGLTWAHKDFIVEVAPQELACLCDCTGKSVYDNNIMTKLLFEKINALESPYYEAFVRPDLTGVVTYANNTARDAALPSPSTGDVAISNTTYQIYNGTFWEDISDVTIDGGAFAGISTVDHILNIVRDVNTDNDETNDGPKFVLAIYGKPQPAPNYRDLEVNYVYPRGVRITPTLLINGDKSITFTEVQDLRYEQGAGYDMRHEEFCLMSLHTKLNFYPQLSDGIASPDLVYQFENGQNYSGVTFEFDSDKVERSGTGDTKRFTVTLATTDFDVNSDLNNLFNPS